MARKCNLNLAKIVSGSTSAVEGIQVSLNALSRVVLGDRVTLGFLLMAHSL